jgi:transcriptional regulator with XRE-family HTH domain
LLEEISGTDDRRQRMRRFETPPLDALEWFLSKVSHMPLSTPSGRRGFSGTAQVTVPQLQDWNQRYQPVPRTLMPELLRLLQQCLEVVHQQLSAEGEVPLDEPIQQLHWLLHRLEARCSLGVHLYTYREEKGLSLQDIERRVGLVHAFLGQIERAAVGLPTIEAAQLLLEEIGLSPYGAAAAPREAVREPEGPPTGRGGALNLLRKRVNRLDEAEIWLLADIAASLARHRESAVKGTGLEERGGGDSRTAGARPRRRRR